MIPVKPQPEPNGFDKDVRQKGHEWLQKNGVGLNSATNSVGALPTYWRSYNRHLWESYDGICAYLSFHFAFVSGAGSTDHFIAKSANVGKAYDWDNYRLACLGANQRKNKYDDVLDPFTIPQDTFFLILDTGEIYVNKILLRQNKKVFDLAKSTMDRLKLDSVHNREMRLGYIDAYINNDISEGYLMSRNPFVYYEMKRQHKLQRKPPESLKERGA